MRIENGVIHTMLGPVIPSGFVSFREGKITDVGPMEACPKGDGETVYDAGGGHVTPGFVDAHCHLGMFQDGQRTEQGDANEFTDPVTPQLRAIDAIYPQDPSFREARLAGVTTVLTGPGSANAIGGTFAALKTRGDWVDEMLLSPHVSMKMALGENPKQAHAQKNGPATRMSTAALIRSTLERAQEYDADRKREPPVPYEARYSALLPVLHREMPIHVHAHRADDIATALRIAREYKLRCTIVHGTQGHLLARHLRQAEVSVITGPCLLFPDKPELAGQSLETPAKLHRAGVKIAICTDHPEVPIQFLPLCAAMGVRGGLEMEEALCAITRYPAEIAGLEQRVGSLAKGLDADLVVTDRHPLDWLAKVKAVWIDGTQVTE